VRYGEMANAMKIDAIIELAAARPFVPFGIRVGEQLIEVSSPDAIFTYTVTGVVVIRDKDKKMHTINAIDITEVIHANPA
jgi:hypothetical protein